MTKTQPMSSARRSEIYAKQRSQKEPTPRQVRRWLKKRGRLFKKGIEKGL